MKKLIALLFLFGLTALVCSHVSAESSGGSLKPAELKEFSDLRAVVLRQNGTSLESMDLRECFQTLLTATFDTNTVWPAKSRMPEKFNPAEIIEMGRDPGLGIRRLQIAGVTGSGVRVAIIDQPLLRDHEEYAGKVKKYTAVDCEDVMPQMHGAAVASLLVGERCGTAPGADLYYWAEPSWKRDYAYRTEALKQIIAFNRNRPIGERIRVVSVSIGYNNDFKNLDMWKEALVEAKKSGLIVIHCGQDISGAGCPLYRDVNDPGSYRICYYAGSSKREIPPNYLYLPIDNRTSAGFEGKKDYVFWSRGGLSWGPPYLAGVIALALQKRPELSEDLIFELLRETGDPLNKGRLIDPGSFLEKAWKMK
jgi:subtilisin family serine protease